MSHERGVPRNPRPITYTIILTKSKGIETECRMLTLLCWFGQLQIKQVFTKQNSSIGDYILVQ